MSDTPRTDALEARFENENMTRDTPWELARDLERQLRSALTDALCWRHAVANNMIRDSEDGVKLIVGEVLSEGIERALKNVGYERAQ